MKILVTGLNGTIGQVFKRHMESKNHEVIGWDRKKVPINNYHEMENFVKKVNPDALYHLAIASNPTGIENENWITNYLWPSELAWITRILDIKFIFTSTALVFSNNAKGPFSIESEPDAYEEYGHTKRIAEERVFYQNPNATIVRLGWQIGKDEGNNNMYSYIESKMKEEGKIECSKEWYPACSFLFDTAKVLENLLYKDRGLYMFDSNEKWSYYDIVSALKEKYNTNWNIIENSEYKYDQRLIDERLNKYSLKDTLEDLI